jgi:hypothetical protein
MELSLRDTNLEAYLTKSKTYFAHFPKDIISCEDNLSMAKMCIPQSINAIDNAGSSVSLVTLDSLESVFSDSSIRFNLRGRRFEKPASEQPIAKPERQKSRETLDYFDMTGSDLMKNASFPAASINRQTKNSESVHLECVLSSEGLTESSSSCSSSTQDDVLLRFLNLVEETKSHKIKYAPLMPMRKASRHKITSSSMPLSMPVRKASSPDLDNSHRRRD